MTDHEAMRLVPQSVLGPPAGPLLPLVNRPQVLSWDRADAWSQRRLLPYQAEIRDNFAGPMKTPVAFDLHCGFGPGVQLEGVGDLDNYLVPVADALGWANIVSAWGSKAAVNGSALAVGPATSLVLDAADGWSYRRVRTVLSAGGAPWKQEVWDQLSDLQPVSGPAVELVIGYQIGQGRSWRNLWKPTIDSLGPILGEGPRSWHPRDGRISRLGLSHVVEPDLGWAILIDFWWRAASS